MAIKIQLGDKVKDTVTGFEGIAVARTTWIHGCDRIAIQPQGMDKDGKLFESNAFDEMAVVVVKAGAVGSTNNEAPAKKTGGPQNDKTALRRNK